MGSIKRNVAQLKCQWTIIKMNAKRENSARKNGLAKTGGGPADVQKEISGDDIRVWLPEEFEVDWNEFDSEKPVDVDIELVEVKRLAFPKR